MTINLVCFLVLTCKRQFSSNQAKQHWKKLRMTLLGQTITDILFVAVSIGNLVSSLSKGYVGPSGCYWGGLFSSFTAQLSLTSIAIISVLRHQALTKKREITVWLMTRAYVLGVLACSPQFIYSAFASLFAGVERAQDIGPMGTACLVQFPLVLEVWILLYVTGLVVAIVYHYWQLRKFLKKLVDAVKVAERRNEDTDITLMNLTRLVQWLSLTTLLCWFYSIITLGVSTPHLIVFFAGSVLFFINSASTPLFYMYFLPSLKREVLGRAVQATTAVTCCCRKATAPVPGDSSWTQQRGGTVHQVDGELHMLETQENKRIAVLTRVIELPPPEPSQQEPVQPALQPTVFAPATRPFLNHASSSGSSSVPLMSFSNQSSPVTADLPTFGFMPPVQENLHLLSASAVSFEISTSASATGPES